jgi:hypothetical protein
MTIRGAIKRIWEVLPFGGAQSVRDERDYMRQCCDYLMRLNLEMSLEIEKSRRDRSAVTGG